MSSESEIQNRSFGGFRKQRNEITTSVARNTKSGLLSVSGNSTLKGNLSVSGFSTLTSGVKVGTDGSDLYKIVSGTVSVNPESIASVTKGSVNVTLPGLKTTDRVILHPPSTLNAGLLYCGCDVTANNTLTIYLYNQSESAIDDTSRTWKYSYWIFTGTD